MALNPMLAKLVAETKVKRLSALAGAGLPDDAIEVIEFDSGEACQDHRDFIYHTILNDHRKVARLKAEMRIAKAEAKMASISLELLRKKQKLEILKEHYDQIS